MHTKRVKWKDFRIDMVSLHRHVQLLAGTAYLGATAHEYLDLHFSRAVSEDENTRIQEYLDSLTEAGESEKLKQNLARQAAVEAAKQRVIYSDILSLKPAERKILMGLPLTDHDIDSLC